MIIGSKALTVLTFTDRTLRIFLTAACLLVLSVPVQADSDPLIDANRAVHGFNKGMDKAVLRPVAETYTKVTPTFVQRRITSVLNNIDDIKVTINDLLQLKFKQAASDASRLVLNSTLGIGGLFDVADAVLGLEKHEEDFGQTMGYWQVSSGPYIELPFFGPSSVRDSTGMVVDFLLNPTTFLRSPTQQIAYTAGEGISDRAALLDFDELISGDEYVFIRDAYMQRREYLVQDGIVEDTFGDTDFEFDDELLSEDNELARN